ncbi:glycosyltransferase [Cellulomonas sp.]|uniref:glycosyltransferase n=1 Tax=Cellulomonas sp. TaxID=40001 RepID=UPI003BAACB56
MTPPPGARYVASVVIPAHNEERTIGRLLSALTGGEVPLEIVVVCNGCTDRTADVARGHPVIVRELTEPSKQAALREGDAVAQTFPRVYLDADVELSASGILSLTDALGGGCLAAGPRRLVPRAGAPRSVRWYYDVWEALPSVRTSLFGRGAIAMSEEGVRRVSALPRAMSDDLAFSEAFAPDERVVVEEAVVVVHPPRTWADLIRRRTRIATGNHQADTLDLRGSSARTGLPVLLGVVRRDPRLAGKLLVFVLVGVLAQRRARRAARAGDFTTWARDESSRAHVVG